MSNMIDMYLAMNMCERDENNSIYYVGGTTRQYLGKYVSHKIEDGNLTINFNLKLGKAVSFLNINAIATADGVVFE